ILVFQSDLFASVPSDDKFDYIIWNPPFYETNPTDEASLAWRAGTGHDVIQRFANQARGQLSPGGRILIILSSDVDTDRVLSFFQSANFTSRRAYTEQRLFESLSVFEFVQNRPDER
ncbi:MAG: methyltransferase, partial [Bacteroidota bacterium]